MAGLPFPSHFNTVPQQLKGLKEADHKFKISVHYRVNAGQETGLKKERRVGM